MFGKLVSIAEVNLASSNSASFTLSHPACSNKVVIALGLKFPASSNMRLCSRMAVRFPELENKILEGIFPLLSILARVVADSKGNLPSNVLFSNSGNRTAILLHSLMLDDAGNFNPNAITTLLEQAGGDKVKLAELLDAKLTSAMETSFPNIQQRVANFDTYNELAKTDEAAAASFLERNPLANKQPSELWRGLASIDATAQKYFYRPAGEFQSRLFMGIPHASFAYRMTNRWGNFVPTFVDLGPRAAISGLFGVNPRNAIGRISDMLGGSIREGALRGLGPGASFRDAGKAGDGLGKLKHLLECSHPTYRK